MTKKRKVYVPCEHGRLEPHTVTPTIDEHAAAACGNCDCDWCDREPEPYLCTPTSHYEYQQTISETASYGTTWWTTTPLDWMATTSSTIFE